MPKKGVKAWQTEVQDNDSWKQELAMPNLLIVELFSEYFGYTETLTPMIDDIMKGLGDRAEDKVRWRRVNVLQLEEELRSLEEEKKRSGRQDAGGGDEAAADGAQPPKEAGPAATEFSGLQGISKFSGFHHPQPFFIFMRKGEIIDILRSCDPPKLEELTKLYSSDESARNTELSYEIMLKTEEEIQAEKEVLAKQKAHMKKISTFLEKVECEDPMSLVETECSAMFALFVVEEKYAGPALPEEQTWEEAAAAFIGKSIDNVCEFFAALDGDTFETLQAKKATEEEAKEKAKILATAPPPVEAKDENEDEAKE